MTLKHSLLARLRQMTDDQLFNEVYRDPLTGALSRKALTLAPDDIVAVVDLDSQKWVNDTHGHRHGDERLVRLADMLRHAFGDEAVYRIAGDEFVVKFDSTSNISGRSILFNLRRDYPGFSFGIGVGLASADHWLRRDKAARVAAGKRADRGECPPWSRSI